MASAYIGAVNTRVYGILIDGVSYWASQNEAQLQPKIDEILKTIPEGASLEVLVTTIHNRVPVVIPDGVKVAWELKKAAEHLEEMAQSLREPGKA